MYPCIMLVPMLAFKSSNGKLFRLGYGGGYYDRTITYESLTIGIATDEMECNELIIEDHDKPLNWIVTPTRILSSFY